MAEAAGLVMGALGLATIFTTCVESFDIVVRARDFCGEFDLLCTQVRRECPWAHLSRFLNASSFRSSKFG